MIEISQFDVTRFSNRLSGEDYAKLKQELREQKLRLKSIPRFTLKNVGDNASINNDVKGEDRIPIFLSDVQHLLMYSLLGHHSPYVPARWCSLEKYNKVIILLSYSYEIKGKLFSSTHLYL